MKITSKAELEDRLYVLDSEQQERLARTRAAAWGMPYVNLVSYPINSDDLVLIPRDSAEAAQVVIFSRHGKDVRLAAVNPRLPAVITIRKRLADRFGVAPQLYVMSHRSLQAALLRYRAAAETTVAPRDEMKVTDERASDVGKKVSNLQELGQRITTLSPTEILSAIMNGAVEVGSSDIHIEPKEKEARLRYRIDGVLQDVVTFSRDGWKMVLSRLKVLAQLKLNVRDIPQDGSFVLRRGAETYDIRVSTLPGGWGENIVMRLLNRKTEVVKITSLGMKQRDYDLVMKELKRSNGMVLVTGPTGSGKTTSLAAFLNEINNPEYKIITLEDPIEYRIPGIEQTQVDAEAGYTFARGLRSILRQDPDVILVGEIRDTETAEVALHAALTGHLVFSTLHTNDAPGAIVRLVDMGIKPFVIAPAVNMVIAQRLVRVVCRQCAKPYKPDAATKASIRQALEGLPRTIFNPSILDKPDFRLMRVHSCDACHHTGYDGRVGIFEIFSIEGEVEELVLKGANTNQIAAAAKAQGMTTIRQDGYLKVLDRVTTLEEVARVTEE